jgi:hypothetical protein
MIERAIRGRISRRVRLSMLGFFDSESGRVECAPNPFDVKVFAHVSGMDPL